MARTRQEVLDHQRGHKEETQGYAADPPGNRRPTDLYVGFLRELKEEQAGGGQDGSGKKETGTENQRNAVLRTLKANQSDRGKDKCEQTTGDLEIALKDRVGLQRHDSQPHSEEKEQSEARNAGKQRGRATAAGGERSLDHKKGR